MDLLYKQHGAVSWTELMSTDVESAKSFYGELFGWRFDPMPMPDGKGTYEVVYAGEREIGGVMLRPPEAGDTPPHWGSYVTVDDVDAVAAKVSELGGKLLYGPEDIPGVGRFCVIQDIQGAVISAITYTFEDC